MNKHIRSSSINKKPYTKIYKFNNAVYFFRYKAMQQYSSKNTTEIE